MARAIAMCTCEKCGAEFKKIAYRNNRRDAESWEEWAKENYTICPDCKEKEHLARIAEQKKADAAEGLPELTGSEKQINWATDLRQEILTSLNDEMARMQDTLEYQAEHNSENLEKNTEAYKNFEITVEYIRNISSASWWINNRDEGARTILRHTVETAVEAAKLAEPEAESEENDETVLVPENATEGVAEITVTETSVEARYPKDETFRGIVKDAGYRWDGHRWSLQITERTGAAEDRAADLTNRLLHAGFSVRCQNAAVRKMAVDGSYEPERAGWISYCTADEYAGWLCVSVPGRGRDPQGLYDAARRIKGSRYYRGSVMVPMAQYAEAEDFAGLYGYGITRRARKEIDTYQAKTTVRAASKTDVQSDRLSKILKSDDAVLSDLQDD